MKYSITVNSCVKTAADTPERRAMWVRQDKQVKQGDFAVSIGASQSGWANVEGVARSKITLARAITICNVYHVNANWLLLGEGQPYRRRK